MKLAAQENRLSEWESYLDRLTPRQVNVIQAFQRIEPQGEDREDIRQAVAVSAICTASKVSGGTVDPNQILTALRPFEKIEPRELTPEEAASGIRKTRPKNVDRR